MSISRTITALFLAGTFGGVASAKETAAAGLQSLKAVCDELSANDQLKPFKVTVTCRHSALTWKDVGESSVNLPNSREISAAFRVKQYSSETSPVAVAAEKTPASCTVLEKFKSTALVDVSLSCQELKEVSDVTSFCQDAIDARLEENPAQFVEVPTGETFNTCTGVAGTKPNRTVKAN